MTKLGKYENTTFERHSSGLGSIHDGVFRSHHGICIHSLHCVRKIFCHKFNKLVIESPIRLLIMNVGLEGIGVEALLLVQNNLFRVPFLLYGMAR